jgi:DNA-binding NarL/FixJ family response regulator
MAYALDEHPAPAPAPSEAPAVLTAREREIADLIAEGLSNREIASRLTISVRTAETHAQNILMKLGFRSRTQIGTWVAEQRLGRAAARNGDPQP